MEKNYKKTLLACYLGFITQAIVANFTPLLFLKFHSAYGIPIGKLLKECYTLGGCETGKAKITKAYNAYQEELACF